MSLPSPNFGERRGGARPELVVIHYTAMTSCAAAHKRLCLPEAEVSAHWLIGEDGETHQLVAEEMRAWHAGAGSWGGLGDVNSRSIGIELANTGDAPFPEPQMAALETLLRGILGRWNLGPEAVIGHSDMAPDRKIDPGPRFDWLRLARQGLAIWPDSGPAPDPTPESFTALAMAFGYPDVAPETLLSAFRLRFRPRHEGPLDATDMALIADLAARFGSDGGSWRSA
ncbi:N-acetylmuramoyl-L-alanine amidase [Pseudothioclava nitratireducens]|uniref:N-acetylmuramoyl-L-alanine amidase n=1 Tax=Pseudothioclava nitratireducens TaxID=1928646 RepID=UPI0023DB2FE4|nr:N-acetylmuramoyl-L-alanine amidase [Defluviimonas nitratireducens]MDF1621426.1 N-acetylmuramoyl-L-alanine amidase [Defluviimonas nitratireducens]